MKIIFNGLEYDGVEQMPPDVKADYEELTRMFEKKKAQFVPDSWGCGAHVQTRMEQPFEFNGQTYDNLEDMPPEGRALMSRLMEKPASYKHRSIQIHSGAPVMRVDEGSPVIPIFARKAEVRRASTGRKLLVAFTLILISLIFGWWMSGGTLKDLGF